MNTKEIISLVVAGFAGLVWAVLEIRRWKANRRAKKIEDDNHLAPNPTRCTDHETRLRSVEAACLYMSPQIAGIEKDITDIKDNVQYLVQLHMKG